MKNLLKKYRHSEEGFTLIELIIVIAILAIIAAIAIPNIIGAVDDSRKTADIANAKVIANAAAQVKAKNDGFAAQKFEGTAASIALDISTLATGTDFKGELYKALNSSVPVPKYKPTTYEKFYLVITDDKVEVYTGKSTTVSNDFMVYPTPITDYK